MGGLLILFAVQPVRANNPVIRQIADYWFEFTEPSVFTARTYNIADEPSDPQLWLYNSEGTELVTNDDHYGLQSFIEYPVQPGWYRLRAGTCCYQPDIWRPWTTGYELSIGNTPVELPVVSTVEETTTTEELWQTTTTTTIPLTVPPSTTSLPISSSTTTTLLDPTTTTSTTIPPTTSTELSTTTTVAPLSPSTFPILSTTSSLLPMPSTTLVVLPTSPTTSSLAPTTLPTTSTEPTVTTTTTLVIDTTTVVSLPQADEAIASLRTTTDIAVLGQAITAIAASIDTLTADQLDEIALAVSNAPPEIKKQFEKEINIFGGGLDNYVPTGSVVPVGQRRTLVIIGAVLTAMPVISSKRK